MSKQSPDCFSFLPSARAPRVHRVKNTFRRQLGYNVQHARHETSIGANALSHFISQPLTHWLRAQSFSFAERARGKRRALITHPRASSHPSPYMRSSAVAVLRELQISSLKQLIWQTRTSVGLKKNTYNSPISKHFVFV